VWALKFAKRNLNGLEDVCSFALLHPTLNSSIERSIDIGKYIDGRSISLSHSFVQKLVSNGGTKAPERICSAEMEVLKAPRAGNNPAYGGV
jgi:hypothetical protein